MDRSILNNFASWLTRLSQSVFRALLKQAIETGKAVCSFGKRVGEAFVRFVKWSWATYYKLETQILSVTIDLVAAIFALRFFLLLVSIAAFLVIKQYRLLLAVYVIFLAIAIIRYFNFNPKDFTPEKNDIQSHLKWIKFLRWPLRISVTAISAALTFFFLPEPWKSKGTNLWVEFRAEVASMRLPATPSLQQPSFPAATPTVSQQPKYNQISLKNSCSQEIKVAACYTDPKDGWTTKGWWIIAGKTEILTDIHSQGPVIFLYAISSEGKTWSGSGTKDGSTQAIYEHEFIYNERIPEEGAKLVSFFPVKTGPDFGHIMHVFTDQ